MNTQPSDSDGTVDGSDYREKSPGYAAQNMLYRLAKTLRFDQQQAQIRNRAHQAANWRQFEREKDVLPNLKWMPSTSLHPGADHRRFWGTIRPVDDLFWNNHRPGDRWNCTLCHAPSMPAETNAKAK